MDDLISKSKVIDLIMGEPPEAHYPSYYATKIRSMQAEKLIGDTDRWLPDNPAGGGY